MKESESLQQTAPLDNFLQDITHGLYRDSFLEIKRAADETYRRSGSAFQELEVLWRGIADRNVKGGFLHEKRVLLLQLLASLLHKRGYRLFMNGEQLTLRLHFFMLSPSRSGKGKLAKTMGECAKACGLDVVRCTEHTTAAIYGKVDAEALKQNNQHRHTAGLAPGDPFPGMRSEFIPSLMSKSDVMMMNEAESIFTNTQFTSNITRVYQELLDDEGYARKDLSSLGDISINVHFCYIGTTVLPDTLTTDPSRLSRLVSNVCQLGYFQRMMLSVHFMRLQERSSIIKAVLDGSSHIKSPEDAATYVRETRELIEHFAARVNIILDRYAPAVDDTGAVAPLVCMSDRARSDIERCQDKFVREQILKNYSGERADLLGSFVTSHFLTFLPRIAAIAAIVDGKMTVEAKHIGYGERVVTDSCWSIMKLLDQYVPKAKSEYSAERHLQSLPDEEIGVMRAVTIIQDAQKCSYRKAYDIVRKLRSSGYLEERRTGNETILRRRRE